MFKSLRDRLKGVSKKIEDEVASQLEDRLEAELAAEVEKAKAKAAGQPAAPPPSAAPSPATKPPPSPAPAAVPSRGASHSPPAPPAAPDRSQPAVPSSAARTETPTAVRSDSAAAAASPTPVPPTTARPGAPPTQPSSHQTPAPPTHAPQPTRPTQPTQTTQPTQPTHTRPVPSSGPGPNRAPPAAPTTPPPATPTPVPQVQPPTSQPAQQRPHVQQESAGRPKQQQPVTGRKVLSEAEIEARLARELSEAVEVQKAVETVVQTEAKAARFTINEDVLNDILWELEIGLLESDVALPVIEAIKASVKEQLLSMPVGGKSPHEIVEKVLRTAVRRVLNVNPLDFDQFVRDKLAAGKKPVVVMFVGVNGTGKTTSIARIAHRLKQQNIGCVLAAGDTFRAGAIEQLSLHGERLGVKVIKHAAGADPAAVAYDAIEHAKARNREVVLLDTAGRMQTNSNLMDEMDKIRRVANPDLVVFVGDSLAGNDAVEQARKFDEVVDIDGAILTKVDVDAKGGAALSVAYTINKPLLFVGVGQDYGDLRPFDPQWMVDRLFGDDEKQEEQAAAA